MLKKVTSLRFKIMLPVVILSSMILLSGIIYDFRFSKDFVQAQLSIRAKLLATATQFVVESARSSVEVENFVSFFQGELGVNEMVIISGNPLMIEASSKRKWIGQSIEALPEIYRHLILESRGDGRIHEFQDGNHGNIVYVLPIKISSKKTGDLAFTEGHILIEVATEEALGVVLHLLYQHISVLIISVLCIIFAIYWVMKKQILLPIKTIQDSMSKRAAGDTNSFVESHTRDELGQLSQHTNDLYAANEIQKKIIAEQKDTVDLSARVVALAQISGSIVHEINNPLCVINGALFKMENQLQKEGIECQVMKDGINQIQEMTDHIGKIMKGLKNLAHTDRSEELHRVGIKDVVTETFRLYGANLKNLDVEIRLKGMTEEAAIHGQAVQLQQVLLNLVSNSLDAIIHLDERWIEIALEDHRDVWQMTVTDSGLGIKRELHEKILNPFFTTKAAGKGTGLGLPIAVEMVRHLKGELFLNPLHPRTQFVLKFKKFIDQQDHN